MQIINDNKINIKMNKDNSVTQIFVDMLFNEADLTEKIVYNKCLITAIKLRNGFVIVESSSCVDPINFNIDIARQICCDKIKNKIWELEGYKLQDKISNKNMMVVE